METTTKGAAQEKELIRKIKFIESSKEFIVQVNELDEQIREKKKEKFEAGSGLEELKETQKNLKSEIDKISKEVATIDNSKEAVQKQLDKINEERDQIRKAITELRAKKDEQKEIFYRSLIDYEKQQADIKQINWMNEVKAKVVTKDE